MQVKKEHIQNAILKAATEEFLQYGFQKSSMRRMAEHAGTRMSNFYNYFKNKDELFNFIVKEQYQLLQDTLRPIAQSDKSFNFRNISNIKILSEELLQWIQSFTPLFTVETILLTDCSKGTIYEHVKDDLIQDIVIIINKICCKIPERLSKNKYPLELFVRQLLDDIAAIVKQQYKEPYIKDIICNRICTFAAGVFIISY